MVRLVSFAIAIHFALGCSFFGPRKQVILLSSEPLGAQVTRNGDAVGQTPVEFEVARGEDLLIEVRKPGYETQFLKPSRKLSTLGFADTLVGSVLLVPLLGLLSGGAWEYEANQAVILYPVGEGPE